MRINQELRHIMMDFIEKNPVMSTGRFDSSNGREKVRKLWEELTNILNSQGYGNKTVDGWKNTFIDWKSKTKQKVRDGQKYRRGTGGGPDGGTINDLEERLMNLIGWSCIDGDGITDEFIGTNLPKKTNGNKAKTVTSLQSNLTKPNYITTLVENPAIKKWGHEKPIEPLQSSVTNQNFRTTVLPTNQKYQINLVDNPAKRKYDVETTEKSLQSTCTNQNLLTTLVENPAKRKCEHEATLTSVQSISSNDNYIADLTEVYTMENAVIATPTSTGSSKKKTTKFKPKINRDSKRLDTFHNETLNVLQKIENHLGTIATAMLTITDYIQNSTNKD